MRHGRPVAIEMLRSTPPSSLLSELDPYVHVPVG